MTTTASVDVINTITSRWFFAIEGIESLPTQHTNAKPLEESDKAALWARVTVLTGERITSEFAGGAPNNNYRGVGRMVVNVFGPTGVGLDGAGQQTLCDTILSAFSDRSFNTVTFRTGHTEERGRSGKFHQIDVICPFFYEEVNT